MELFTFWYCCLNKFKNSFKCVLKRSIPYFSLVFFVHLIFWSLHISLRYWDLHNCNFSDIPTHLVAWISRYLCSRKQQVGISGANSITVDVISGVPQGSVSPLHGGSEPLISVTCRATLIRLCIYQISDHDLKLNVKKCKSLLLSRKRVATCIQTVVVDCQPLEKV